MALGVFNVFSSIAGLLGSSGQASHSAANAWLDSMASWRLRLGVCGQSVNWGAVAGTGYAARYGADRCAEISGSGAISRPMTFAALSSTLYPACPSFAVLPADWSRLLAGGSEAYGLLAPYFHLRGRSLGPTKSVCETKLGIVAAAASTVELEEIVNLAKHIAGGFVDADAPLMEAGVDSLGAVELRSQLQRAAGEVMVLPSTVVFDHPTARRLGQFLAPTLRRTMSTEFREALQHANAYSMTGTGHCFAAGRISYALSLHGACEAIDVACSSALVACHNACKAVQMRDCQDVLLAGVNMMFVPGTLDAYAAAGLTSPSGKSFVFDSRANGFVRGESCGGGVLQATRLRAFALMVGTAVRQDGRSASLTAPNGWAQQLLLRAVLSDASVMPPHLQLVEAAANGAALGDPIEAGAIAMALLKPRVQEPNALLVGSVKANVGHCESASGSGKAALWTAPRERGAQRAVDGIGRSRGHSFAWCFCFVVLCAPVASYCCACVLSASTSATCSTSWASTRATQGRLVATQRVQWASHHCQWIRCLGWLTHRSHQSRSQLDAFSWASPPHCRLSRHARCPSHGARPMRQWSVLRSVQAPHLSCRRLRVALG